MTDLCGMTNVTITNCDKIILTDACDDTYYENMQIYSNNNV